jgi:hypothetical protein
MVYQWNMELFVGTIASGFESPIFIPDTGKYKLQLAYLRLLSIRSEGERNISHGIKQRKVKAFGHMLRSKCILKHVIDGKIGGKRRRRNFSSYGITLRKDGILEIERGSTSSY